MRLLRVLTVLCAVVGTLTAPAAASARLSNEAAFALLARSATIAGTAWWTDPASGGVVVSADATVAGAELARVRAVAGRAGATLIREPGTLAQRIAGGDAFYNDFGGRCNVGFNVRNSTTYYFLTSGHCVGAVGATVYADPLHTVTLGVVAAINSPYDYALVRYTNLKISIPSAVDLHNGLYQAITAVSSGYVGQAVKRSGVVSGVHSGYITALNVTVNYPTGTVYGLIQANVCAEAGDSGGPLFAGATAIGILSGGTGSCALGGTTYYGSASRAMSQYRVGVY